MGRLADWHRRWTFENGIPKDLWKAKGEWTWNRADKSMDIPIEVRIFPIYVLPDYPLLFTD